MLLDINHFKEVSSGIEGVGGDCLVAVLNVAVACKELHRHEALAFSIFGFFDDAIQIIIVIGAIRCNRRGYKLACEFFPGGVVNQLADLRVSKLDKWEQVFLHVGGSFVACGDIDPIIVLLFADGVFPFTNYAIFFFGLLGFLIRPVLELVDDVDVVIFAAHQRTVFDGYMKSGHGVLQKLAPITDAQGQRSQGLEVFQVFSVSLNVSRL